MKKILIICANAFGYNGIAAVILNEYKAFDKEKMQIDLLFNNEPSEEIKEIFTKNNSKLYIMERNKKKQNEEFNAAIKTTGGLLQGSRKTE